METAKRKRIGMMVSGAFAIFFTGYPHVWSVYQPYVMEQAGWTQGQASMCFYLALATFVFGNVIGGRMQDQYNPRIVVWIGGGIFAAGILASAFFIMASPLPIYLTYGVMQGFGQGMIYTTIISTAQKWFPERTGFASGIVVTANGLCGFFMAPISRKLLDVGGVEFAFLVIGGVIAISWILCGIFFCAPETSKKDAVVHMEEKNIIQRQYTSAEMMRTKRFYLLLATMLFGLLPYFILSPVSQTYQIDLGISSSVAVSAVMFGSVMNAGTRLALPTLADRVGRVVCIRGVLAVSIVAMVILTVSGSYPVSGAIVLMYGCYGGIMGSFPSFTSSVFGLAHAGENYGYVMFGIVIATLGAPAILNVVVMSGWDMSAAFGIGAVSAMIAMLSLTILSRILKAHERKRDANSKERSMQCH